MASNVTTKILPGLLPTVTFHLLLAISQIIQQIKNTVCYCKRFKSKIFST